MVRAHPGTSGAILHLIKILLTNVCVHEFMTLVFRTSSRDSILSVSVPRVYVVFSTAGLMTEESPGTRISAALRRGIQKTSHTKQSHVSSECVTAKFFFAPGQDLFNFWYYEVRPSDLLTLCLLLRNGNCGVNANYTVYTQCLIISRRHKNILCNCQTDFP